MAVVSSQPTLTQLEVIKLERLRASVVTFHNQISSLPAKERNAAHNEEFNQYRREAKALLKQQNNFEQAIPQAMTDDIQAERTRKKVIPRLFTVITIGVILALIGMGLNSIILDDLIINSLGCIISLLGILMVIGAFAVFQGNQVRRRESNYGELYLHCTTLLEGINHTLDNFKTTTSGHPDVPSVHTLILDSLHNQALDWQQKLTTLEEKRQSWDTNEPIELTANINFVQSELERIQNEIKALGGPVPALPATTSRPESPALLSPPSASQPPIPAPPIRPPLARGHQAPPPARRPQDKTPPSGIKIPPVVIEAPPPVEITPTPEISVSTRPDPTPEVIDPPRHTPEKAAAHTMGMPPIEKETPADRLENDELIIEKASAHTMGMPPVEKGSDEAIHSPDRASANTMGMPPIAKEAPTDSATDDSHIVEKASAHTMGMPPVNKDEGEADSTANKDKLDD